jgi:hypothetical protein
MPVAAETLETLETLEPAGEPEAFAEVEADADAEAADLSSLATAAEPTAESAGFNFLSGESAKPQSGGDDKLDDFFKSLT